MKKFLFLILTFTLAISSCRQQTQSVPPENYSSRIVGNWQGTMGNYYKENIRFKKDNTFEVQLHSGGFIGNTISQGVYGNASGNWRINGNSLTLEISKADEKSLFDQSKKYNILSFMQDEIKLADEKGDTTVFVRIHGM